MKKQVLFYGLIFLFYCFQLSASPSQPICLNMIVKNESAVIRRCLDSVKPIIDYWIIVDTGSTDGTQEIIKDYLKDIPGELHERPWKNFSWNRNEALQLAKGKGDYILFVDADDILKYDSDFHMPHLTHDLYYLWHACGGSSFLNHHFVRADLPWKWVGVVHEFLECSKDYTSAVLNKVVYQMENDGASHHDPKKFLKYVDLLEQSLLQDPNNRRDTISLARSYRGAGMKEKALEYYEKVIQMGDQDEELFRALIDKGQLQRELGYPIDIVLDTFLLAHRLFPLRPEPIYYQTELYNQEQLFELAYACLKGWSMLDKPQKKSFFFNEDWIDRYGLLFELSLCSYYIGHYQESLDSSSTLLSMENIPTSLRVHIEQNRRLALNKVTK
jgi:glycosyltransferase involved in cell wall biosynthesis